MALGQIEGAENEILQLTGKLEVSESKMAELRSALEKFEVPRRDSDTSAGSNSLFSSPFSVGDPCSREPDPTQPWQKEMVISKNADGFCICRRRHAESMTEPTIIES